jgi:fructose transport system ATP-binding protein
MVTTVADDTVLLRAVGLTKHYGGVSALAAVSFEMRRGEQMALVGDNGAGKSTLVSMLSGALRPDSGRIWIDGSECKFRSPQEAKNAGIETVYQNLAVIDQLDVIANLFLGHERRLLGAGPLSVLDRKGMTKDAETLLARTGVEIPDMKQPLRNLSGGQRQGVAIARAAGWGSKLIIMDEPTAALGIQETKNVEKIIAGIRDQGIATIIVSHNLRQVFALADSVCIMRRGRMVGHLKKEDCTLTDVVRLITGVDGALGTDFV